MNAVIYPTGLNEIALQIFQYLDPTCFAQTIYYVCKTWQRLCVSSPLWKRYCQQRWGINTTAPPTRYGAQSYYHVYFLFHRVQKLPMGPYIQKNRVWGKYRGPGIDAWFLLVHQTNSHGIRFQNRYLHQLRLIVQNTTSSNGVTIDLENIHGIYKDGTSCKVCLTAAYQPKSIAKNQQRIESEERFQTIPFLQYLVISLFLACPVSSEPEFLERIASIWIPIQEQLREYRSEPIGWQSLLPKNYYYGGISIGVFDESLIWDQYKMYAGGFVALMT